MSDDLAMRTPVNQQHQRKARRTATVSMALGLVAAGTLAGFAAQQVHAIAAAPGLFLGAILFLAATLLTALTAHYTILSCTDFRPREGLLQLDDRRVLHVRFLPSTTAADHYVAHVRQLGKTVPLDMPVMRPVLLRRLNAMSRHHTLVIGAHVLTARDIVNTGLQMGWNDF